MKLADKAYNALSTPMTARQLGKRLDISMAHATNVIRKLRQEERVRVAGDLDGSVLWGRMLFRVPASEREEQPYETARWLENYLDLWQRFMRSYWGPHGYPQTSPGFPSKARIQSFEDMEEESDRNMVAVFDARIDDLEPKDRSAIFYCYGLTHVWPYTEHPADAADLAKWKLARLLREWVAVP